MRALNPWVHFAFGNFFCTDWSPIKVNLSKPKFVCLRMSNDLSFFRQCNIWSDLLIHGIVPKQLSIETVTPLSCLLHCLSQVVLLRGRVSLSEYWHYLLLATCYLPLSCRWWRCKILYICTCKAWGSSPLLQFSVYFPKLQTIFSNVPAQLNLDSMRAKCFQTWNVIFSMY